MSESYRAVCTDFYVNQKVQVKMDLPRSRETVLELFERTRKQFPRMETFRRYKEEYALESPQTDRPHRWLSLRASSLRSGTVNPGALEEAYALHRFVHEAAPAYLSISPLDVDFIELLYGFDLQASGNHDAIVLEAVLGGSPMAAICDIPHATPTDVQPMVGLAVGEQREFEVCIEVKTRTVGHSHRESEQDPISVYLTLRKFGPFRAIEDVRQQFELITRHGEAIIENRVVPGLLVPIRDAIASGNA